MIPMTLRTLATMSVSSPRYAPHRSRSCFQSAKFSPPRPHIALSRIFDAKACERMKIGSQNSARTIENATP
jgi:hypothetical protein